MGVRTRAARRASSRPRGERQRREEEAEEEEEGSSGGNAGWWMCWGSTCRASPEQAPNVRREVTAAAGAGAAAACMGKQSEAVAGGEGNAAGLREGASEVAAAVEVVKVRENKGVFRRRARLVDYYLIASGEDRCEKSASYECSQCFKRLKLDTPMTCRLPVRYSAAALTAALATQTRPFLSPCPGPLIFYSS